MSESKIYVGNLNFSCSEQELEQAFSAYGKVLSVSLVTDRDTGRPRGFGFVEMGTPQEAQAAIQGLDQKELGGRMLRVNLAKPREAGGGGSRSFGDRPRNRW